MKGTSPVARTALALLILPLGGCSQTDDAPPVATVSFSTNKSRVALNSPIDLTYRFDVAPGASIPEGYRVFVHVKDDQGDRIWDDDHDPPVPPSEWRPGQTVQYTRTRFVPVFPYIGDVTVEIGLHHDNERLPLQGPDPADRQSISRSYKVGALEILPMSENVFVFNTSGWHPAEFAPETPTLEWEWTQKVAGISFRNPRRDVTFYLEYDARPDVFPDGPQQVTVFAANQPVYTFAADQPVHHLHRIPISAAQLGADDMVEIRLELDKIFVPANLPSGGRDARELGIRVYHKFIEVR